KFGRTLNTFEPYRRTITCHRLRVRSGGIISVQGVGSRESRVWSLVYSGRKTGGSGRKPVSSLPTPVSIRSENDRIPKPLRHGLIAAARGLEHPLGGLLAELRVELAVAGAGRDAGAVQNHAAARVHEHPHVHFLAAHL